MTDRTRDISGRHYAKLSELQEGNRIELDDGFTCRVAGEAEVIKNKDGNLCFMCTGGDETKDSPYTEYHNLSGQADDGEHCVGIYKL